MFLKFKEELIAEKVWDQPIVTQVEKIDIFYPAEDYHHNYFNNNKSQGYCQFVIQPKIEKYKKKIYQIPIIDNKGKFIGIHLIDDLIKNKKIELIDIAYGLFLLAEHERKKKRNVT